jgi:hypothetical protein
VTARSESPPPLSDPSPQSATGNSSSHGARPVHSIITMISGFGPVDCQYRTVSLPNLQHPSFNNQNQYRGTSLIKNGSRNKQNHYRGVRQPDEDRLLLRQIQVPDLQHERRINIG